MRQIVTGIDADGRSCVVEEHVTGERGRGDELVHPVEDAEEGRLPAPRGTDERGDPIGLHHQRDAVEHLVVPEPRGDLSGDERGGDSRAVPAVGSST